MEYHEINKSLFKDSYNIVKILTSKTEIMEFVKTLKDNNNNAVAFAIRKQHKLTVEEKLDLIMNEIKSLKTEIQMIKNRLDRNHIH